MTLRPRSARAARNAVTSAMSGTAHWLAVGDDVEGDVAPLAVLVLGALPQEVARVVGADAVSAHQDALGLLDHAAMLHRRAQVAGQGDRLPLGDDVRHDDRGMGGETVGDAFV